MPRDRAGRSSKPLSLPQKSKPRFKKSSRPSANAYAFENSKSGKRAQGRAQASDDHVEGVFQPSKGKSRQVESDSDDFAGFENVKMGADDSAGIGGDDEELDSDAADTEGEFDTPRLPKSMTQRPRPTADIDLEEGFSTDGKDEGDDYMDISEMLNGDTATSESDDDDSGSDDADVDGLDALVESLPSRSKRKDTLEGEPARKKRRIAQERTEAGDENEFAAIGVRSAGKVRLEDMLSALPIAQRLALQKSLKPLASPPEAVRDAPKRALKASGPLPAPLPLLAQAKIDRAAANEQLEKELEGWNDTLRTMKGIGRPDQAFGGNRLTLPLGAPSGPTQAPNSGELLSKFVPINELEKSVREVLAAANLAQSSNAEAESAALSSLSPQEVAARTAEVRKQRELLFRAERKAKRVAKIKSKTYHRLQKKARQRQEEAGEGGLTLQELAQLDEADGGNRAREMREKLEMIRAKERATLRHAPGASKWSQAIRGIQGLDENDQAALTERANVQEELRRRILGDDDSDSDSFVGELPDNEDLDEEAIRASAFDELANFEANEEAKAAGAKPSGLAAMKFMQRAEEKRRRQADELEAEFKAELNGDQPSGRGQIEKIVRNTIAGNPGRKRFTPSTSHAQVLTSVPADDASKARETKSMTTGPVNISLGPTAQPSYNPFSARPVALEQEEETAAVNPWLVLDASQKISRKKDKTAGRDIREADRAALKFDKQKRRTEAVRKEVADQAQIVIDTAIPSEDDINDEPVHIDPRRARFDQQQELVARAFAGDDVIADFAEAKKQEIDRDAPKDVDETLPGWGTWGGKGVRKSKRAPIVRHIPGIDANKRKDAKLSHVIISERRDRKSTKYLVKDIPFPYTSAAQREQVLRQPLGKEFATESSNKIATKPKVLVRPGVLVEPVSKGA